MQFLTFLRDNAPWLTVGVLLTFLSSVGQTFFISLFAGHIRETFSLSHGEWGGIYTLATTGSALAMVWAGGLTDHFRVRVLAPIILIMAVLACVAMALNPVWWGLIPIIFALRFTGQGMTSHMAVVAMSRWFLATRGKALSIATLGFAIGEALLPLVFVALMALYDWRILWGIAALMTIAGIPLVALLLRQERTPQSLAKSNQSFGMLGRHWSRNQTISHFLFWFMVPALLGPPAFNTAFFFHQVHFADIKGMSHMQLVAMYPFYTVVVIAAMVGSGWAIDRFGTPRLMPYWQLPMVLGFVYFAAADTQIGLLVGLFFFAVSTGFMTTIPNAFWAEFYGTGKLGSIKAMAAAVMVLGSAIGPGVTGVLIDLGLGLESQYYLVAGYFVFATVMMSIGVSRARRLLPLAA